MLTAFTQARLLVTDRVGQFPTVEVAHEALLRKWDRLREWIEQTLDDRRLLRQLKVAALEWDQNSSQDAYRWPDERLKAVYVTIRALELQQEREFTPTEREFIRRESDRLLQEINNPNTPHSRRSWIGERLSAIGDPRPAWRCAPTDCRISTGAKWKSRGIHPSKLKSRELAWLRWTCRSTSPVPRSPTFSFRRS